MKSHHITYLLLLTILLIEGCDCGCHNCGYDWECYATNTVTLLKNGIPVDTFNFYDTQHTTFANKCISVEEACLTKDPFFFSKDSVLNFFYPQSECYELKKDFSKDCGIIVGFSDLYAPVLFITPEGYKLLESYDYDSVIMLYTFNRYMYRSREKIDKLKEKGYKFY